MLKIAVCDDLSREREIMRRFLENYLTGAGYEYIITEYAGGEPLAADYEEGDAEYDLIFLDIFMGKMDGMQTARKIRAKDARVSIVFLTASPDFALEGYDVKAIGYLLKPMQIEKASVLLDCFLREEYVGIQKSLFLREGARGTRIPYREILFVESQRNVLLLHMQNQIHRLYRTMAEIETELCEPDFLRCHKSFLVNLNQINAAEKNEFIMVDGSHVPIRQRDAKNLRNAYFSYLLEQTPLIKL